MQQGVDNRPQGGRGALCLLGEGQPATAASSSSGSLPRDADLPSLHAFCNGLDLDALLRHRILLS